MYREAREIREAENFNYAMQRFNMARLNKQYDEGDRAIKPSLKASVQKHETIRLEILMRFTKYSVKDLKHFFTTIDVETEAQRILAKLSQDEAA